MSAPRLSCSDCFQAPSLPPPRQSVWVSHPPHPPPQGWAHSGRVGSGLSTPRRPAPRSPRAGRPLSDPFPGPSRGGRAGLPAPGAETARPSQRDTCCGRGCSVAGGLPSCPGNRVQVTPVPNSPLKQKLRSSPSRPDCPPPPCSRGRDGRTAHPPISSGGLGSGIQKALPRFGHSSSAEGLAIDLSPHVPSGGRCEQHVAFWGHQAGVVCPLGQLDLRAVGLKACRLPPPRVG